MPTELLEVQDTVDLLRTAKRHLAAGKPRKAEQVCEHILKTEQNAAAAHLLGELYESCGRRADAARWFSRAAEWEAQCAEYQFSYARVMQAQGSMQEAAGAWLAGVENDPSNLTGHLGLADTLISLGLLDAAMIAAKQALLIAPDDANVHERMGHAAERAGSLGEAAEAYRKSLELRPNAPENWLRLASVQRAVGNLAGSSNALRRAVDLRPSDPGYRFHYALVLADLHAFSEAIDQLRKAVSLRPHFPEAWSNLGMWLRAERRFAESESCYKKACAQNPDFALAWNNLANLYVELSQLEQAERCYAKAIACDPNYAEPHTGRAMLRLLSGRFDEGWREYEWRRRQNPDPRAYACPEWDGSSLKGRTILLHHEQGAGDTIQFIRYARLLKAQGARVILQCPVALCSLMAAVPELDDVVCGSDSLPGADFHAPLMSLPLLCGTSLENIPAETPYLIPPCAQIPEVLADARALRVALVWSGNPNHLNDRNRSIDSHTMAKLLGIEGARFFSLQVGHESATEAFPGLPIVDLAPHLLNYLDTANYLQYIDLTITVDTSVAHLAGALGRPVWMLLPRCNDWRWLLNRSDSPWYPSMRIFRQKTLGEWSDVLEEVANECRTLAGEPPR